MRDIIAQVLLQKLSAYVEGHDDVVSVPHQVLLGLLVKLKNDVSGYSAVQGLVSLTVKFVPCACKSSWFYLDVHLLRLGDEQFSFAGLAGFAF